jgi:nitroreductase
MDLPELVRARRMVRAYDPARPVPRAALSLLLDLGTRAPSAGFSQGWDFLVLTADQDRDRFWTATTDLAEPPDSWLSGMRTATALVVCLSDKDRYLDRYAEPDKGWQDRDEARWPVPYWDVDTGMAAMVMLLTAVHEGLAGCFFGVPPARTSAVLAAFDIPENRRIVGVVSLGYAATDRRSPSLRRGRRPLSEVAHDGRFGTPWASAAPAQAPAASAAGGLPSKQ